MDVFTLRDFMEIEYKNNREKAASCLENRRWLVEHGFKTVFLKGEGEGVYSPKEGIVVVLYEAEEINYFNFEIYEYNENWETLF